MRLPHYDTAAPTLDSATFLALLRQRAKALPHEDVEPPRAGAYEQSEESQPCLPTSSTQAAAAATDKLAQRHCMDDKARSMKRLEAKKAEAMARKQEAMARKEEANAHLQLQQEKLAEVQERLAKLNEDKHALVIQLKQALQHEGSMKRVATQGPLLSPRIVTPRLSANDGTGPAAPESGAQLLFDTAMPAAQHTGPQTAPAPPSSALPFSPLPLQQMAGFTSQEQELQGVQQGKGQGQGWPGGLNDEDTEMAEEGEVVGSPPGPAWAGTNQAQPAQPSGRNAWLPPHLQHPGTLQRPQGWQQPSPPAWQQHHQHHQQYQHQHSHQQAQQQQQRHQQQQQQGGPAPGMSQLPPHLNRQNAGPFPQMPTGAHPGPGMQHMPAWAMQQGGSFRGRPGQGVAAPGWGMRDGRSGMGPWQHGSNAAGQQGMFGRRGPFYQ